jgi:hypothetical protein
VRFGIELDGPGANHLEAFFVAEDGRLEVAVGEGCDEDGEGERGWYIDHGAGAEAGRGVAREVDVEKLDRLDGA